MTVEVRRADANDYERVAELRDEAFRKGMHSAAWLRGDGYVLTADGRIEATLLAETMGQFFGGRAVPGAAVSGVVVDTRMRGRGYSTTIMREAFVDLRRRGIVLSTLYPSIVGTYRRAGYEIAGMRVEYRTRIDGLPSSGDATRVEPWDDDQFDEVAACYRRIAQRNDGMFDRSPEWWRDRVLKPGEQRLHRHLVRREGDVTGYLTYSQEPTGGNHAMEFAVVCRDFLWEDADAAEALLAFLRLNRPFGTDLRWIGPVHEPLTSCLTYMPIEPNDMLPMMLRLLDVRAALEGRGYPRALATSIELSITDPLLPENSGALRITVADGRATVDPLPSATACVDVTTLATLYTGWLRAGDAARLGRLHGATAEEIERIDLLFAGPQGLAAGLDLNGEHAMDVRTVAVVGAGVMGAGIAQSFAINGYHVHLHDVTDLALERALDRIENHRFGLRKAVERGKLAEGAVEGVLDRIAPTTDLAEACAGIDLAVEAVPEDLALKMQVFRRMDELAPRHAILTSNAAGLSITALAYATTRPELVLGWHWSQPASIMRLAELIKHPGTSAEAVETVSEVARRCGKNPIAINDQPEIWGFVVNRINAAVRREARRIVDEGVADEDQVDQLMKDCFRWPMGPFEMLRGEGFN